jgi:hypothetical protein
MSEDQRNGDGQGGEQQPGGEYLDYSQQAEAGQEGYPEGDPEGYPEGDPEGEGEEDVGYHGRTGVPDYVPQDDTPPDPSLKEKNTSGIIKIVIGVAVVLLIGGFGAYSMLGSQKEIKAHEDAAAAFNAAHLKGFVPFWKKVDIRIGSDKDVINFQIRTLALIQKEATRVPFAKRLKAEAVPILDAALADYEAVKAPEAYAEKYKAVVAAYKAIKDTTLDLSGQLLMIDHALTAQTKLTRRSDAWFNAQTWEDPQYHAEAFDYYKLLTCILDKPIADLKATDLAGKVDESCAADKTAWFKRVAVDCFPVLLEEKATPDDAFKTTVEAYRKAGLEAAKATPKPEGPVIDEMSVDSVRACAEAGRLEFEQALAKKFKAAFLAYEDAKKVFLKANVDALSGK